MRNRKVSTGWNSWVEVAAGRREALEQMRRGLASMVARPLPNLSPDLSPNHNPSPIPSPHPHPNPKP